MSYVFFPGPLFPLRTLRLCGQNFYFVISVNSVVNPLISGQLHLPDQLFLFFFLYVMAGFYTLILRKGGGLLVERKQDVQKKVKGR